MPMISVNKKVTDTAHTVAYIHNGRKCLTSVFLSNQGHRPQIIPVSGYNINFLLPQVFCSEDYLGMECFHVEDSLRGHQGQRSRSGYNLQPTLNPKAFTKSSVTHGCTLLGVETWPLPVILYTCNAGDQEEHTRNIHLQKKCT